MPRPSIDDLVRSLGGPGGGSAHDKLVSIICGRDGPEAVAAVAALAQAVVGGADAAEGSAAWVRVINATAVVGNAVRQSEAAAARIAGVPAALPALVAALRGEGAISINAAAAVAKIVNGAPAAARTLLEPGCLAGLAAALGNGRPEAATYSVAGVLNQLASSSSAAAARIGNCPGVVAAMVSALARAAAVRQPNSSGTSSASDESTAAALLSVCLGSIARADAGIARTVAATPGALSALVALAGSGDGKNAGAALLALAALSPASPEAALAVTEAPVLQALAAALASRSFCMASMACSAIGNAIMHGGDGAARRVAAAPGALPALVRAAASEDQRHAGAAVTILRFICAVAAPEMRQVAAAPGALDALAAALRRWQSSRDRDQQMAWGYAAEALATIAATDAAHARLVAAAAPDMPELLVRALSPRCSVIAIGAGSSLCLLLAAPPELRVRLYEAGAAEACVELLRRAESAGDGLHAMHNAGVFLADADADRCMAAPGLLEALARAAGCGEEGEARVEFQAAAAFAHIAEAAPQHARRLAGSGKALGALAALLCSGSADTVHAAVCALRAAAAEAPGAVAAALAAPSAGPRARALLQQPPLSLPAEAAGALTLTAAKETALQSRVAALEAVAAAAGRESEAARPEACVACGQEAGAGVRLKPCASCAAGPAGRVLYCGAACQRADWKRHKAFCKLAAAAAKEAGAAAAGSGAGSA
ncbi:hypothetical protein Rsub_01849 [Raphidocelis subcapitata]|uniref:MYND-type domain-containing protein n=1 Tax=Raphidocelis subcapitata TaxID=307507 RepID=A0A2V0NR68_9CHLO|nr:hypothetical protein Rsub_01849 [Raphidocelis subcapitata]|eukprot:GBF89132.1 hypothetical protein Rsub_01849 [Raphidocelis subcapitata]